jgi:U2-associated protein SR140
LKMTDKSKSAAAAFSDLSNKLTNPPSKKSLFERQKAEAEAKRLREEKETAAVYEDFVKSFDHNDDNDELLAAVGHGGSGRGGFSAGRGSTVGGGGGPGKRHFTARGGKNSGPGSLGPNPGMRNGGPGSLGPVPSATRGYRGQKRPFNEYGRDRDLEKERSHAMFSYNDHDRSSSGAPSTLDAATVFRTDDDEEAKNASVEKAAPKPTLHLSSLPPGTSPAFVKSLIPASSIIVENVRILPSSQPSQSSRDRKSTSAIVTLPTDTPATDIDTLVSQLQNKYLGFGFYLSISRHLSSAALGAGGITAPTSSMTNLPFGARLIPQHVSLSRGAPPPGLGGHRGGFAPPASYTSSTPYGQRTRDPPTQVLVNPPSDLKQLKLIHLTLEALLTHGPEFEALLMSRRDVQRDEKWAWIWDARSRGGVYYRWRLWAISTDADLQARRGGNGGQFVFENSAPWIPPETGLKFEYTTKMDEFIEDEAYDSSDEEDYDDEARNQRRRRADQLAEGMGGGVGDAAAADADGTGYLNPLSKAKLVHLLARLPDSNTKLRKGDVARVTAFAIEHAGEGADEVASIITANVRRPLSSTSANPERQQEQEQQQGEEDNEDSAMAPRTASKQDTTPASLVSLYLISDILMSSTTSGVRHAWRYRALFETSLKSQKTFEYLGKVDRELGWGRLKAEKWKRSVQTLLSMWEGWCVFPQSSQEGFAESFVNPPGLKEEKSEREKEEAGWKKQGSGKWRSVEDGDGLAQDEKEIEMEDVDGVAMVDEGDDLDGEPMMDEDDFLMGTDEDLDGEPMIDSSDEEAERQKPADGPTDEKNPRDETGGSKQDDPKNPTDAEQAPQKRQRPKAVDMFADESDEE